MHVYPTVSCFAKVRVHVLACVCTCNGSWSCSATAGCAYKCSTLTPRSHAPPLPPLAPLPLARRRSAPIPPPTLRLFVLIIHVREAGPLVRYCAQRLVLVGLVGVLKLGLWLALQVCLLRLTIRSSDRSARAQHGLPSALCNTIAGTPALRGTRGRRIEPHARLRIACGCLPLHSPPLHACCWI